MPANIIDPFNSTKLVSMNKYLNEMVKLYDSKKFPKVLLLNGKKGIGKFTLVIHFLNYVYTQNDSNTYSLKDSTININSNFYKQLLNQTNQDIVFIKAEENKNIKIEEIRNLKSTISKSPLSNNPRFIVIDEVEFINESSVNALLKTLEEPSNNNFFILINNKQAELIKTISSRCFITNIFLNKSENSSVIDYLIKKNDVETFIKYNNDLSPGLFIRYNDFFLKLNISKDDKLLVKINKLLNGYKKIKDKTLISLISYLIDQYFYKLTQSNRNSLDLLSKTKLSIFEKLNDLTLYNLNVNSVLHSIETKLKNV
jgi:DNA polymerase III subunit delta'